MNIYYFDLSVNCSLFFISLFLDPITLCLSLPFSVFTHYPLTQFHTLTPSACLIHSDIIHLFYSSLTFYFPYPPTLLSPPPLLLCIASTVRSRKLSSKVELVCQYSESIQVKSASWNYQNKSRRLHMTSNSPGSITTSVSLPITHDTAGNYTCTLKLKNGQTIWAVEAVPPEGG